MGFFLGFKTGKKGGILVARGPSGSGKSTAIRTCALSLGLQIQTWSPQDIDSEGTFGIPYFAQLLQYLVNVTSVKKSIRVPGCINKALPNVLILHSLPTIYSDSQISELKNCLSGFTDYSNKLVCFVFSDMSLKNIQKIFSENNCKIFE